MTTGEDPYRRGLRAIFDVRDLPPDARFGAALVALKKAELAGAFRAPKAQADKDPEPVPCRP